jgi:hypothetical protein
MRGAPSVVSVAEHAGWAHIVVVAARDSVPLVVERRRVALIGAGLPTQPYHHDDSGVKRPERRRVRRHGCMP